ncbi:lysine-rich nucleolar protein 1 isoform X25 [Hippocampus zosterae]|uniref:lysine-rich nucleolar protein 1 isoform X23 n=1 Tax=Hippocampus zosterae TaxID=109293 RepID=UPI00223E8CB1|nr:lysine-rich nucleolar protein 1 isoform X23 [Hippocampus zosterae]XP_051940871.1 lysine-rich nucleolar protein 1 isoform X25 [Hippocampus zosterae]
MNEMCKTNSDEVLFISETIAPSVQMTVVIDQAKRLALQRDIDLESLPKQLSKLSTALVQRPEEKMKMKIENLTHENVEKKIKKCKKEPTSPTKINDPAVADRTAQRIEKKKKKVKKEDSVVEVQESFEVGEEEKEKKKKMVNGCDIINGNGKETKLTDCQEGPEKTSHEKKSKNKTHINEEIVTPVDENIAKEAKKEKNEVHDKKVAKKAKKEKNEVHDKKAAKKEQNEVHDKKVAKKAKKEQNEVHDTNGYHVTDDSLVVKKKMNKKREKEKSECKKKKRKDSETQTKHETVWQQEEADNVLKTTKKQQNKTPHTIAEDNLKHKKKRKKITAEQDETTAKKKKKTAEPKLAGSQVATETPEEVCEPKPKRKKKKNASPDNDKSEDSNKEAAREEKAAKSDAGVEEGETKRKKKGEKAKKRKSSELDTRDETASTKKKKRKVEEPKQEETVDREPSKKRKRKSSVEVGNHLEEVYPDSSMKEKKKEKKKKEEKKKKKKGMKEELDNHVDVPHGDVVFLSEKSGNTDELNINQERRQALQMEVDKASYPQKVAQPSGFGQWSTAQFESSQQQQKFLRLMGGFKKDSQPAAAESPRTANMALGKNGQERLQQGLVEEFERAHSRRVDFNSRGVGLGFCESTKKKFFIDKNLRRSVRFDD